MATVITSMNIVEVTKTMLRIIEHEAKSARGKTMVNYGSRRALTNKQNKIGGIPKRKYPTN